MSYPRYQAYKDSGIEWLGEVPEHWTFGLLSSMFLDNKVKNKGMIENNLLSLSYGKIIEKDIETTFGLLPDSFEGYQIVEPGHVVLRLTDLQNDKKSLRTGYVAQRGIITSAYNALVKKSNAIANTKYFHQYLPACAGEWKIFENLFCSYRLSFLRIMAITVIAVS
ncbi:MAG: hypothetical protein H8E79_01675 [Desulfobulbaceae bacterium]|uniref:Type I restriction modification DNA specificity domain-containing protein n=1 Tax=Candidatus Desulfatifera sulfidica TaxID=2841691 RepID=A0A8J6TD13_9BACT|nr:hypothetical protein [Candidatus Desulfatifera sulfidica]